jgi:transcriptional regulator with XRE-family HTH domain
MSAQNPFLRAFGLHVRQLREFRGLTQEGLGEKAELDQTYISGIERGTRNPSVLVLKRVAAALDIPVSRLFEGVGK